MTDIDYEDIIADTFITDMLYEDMLYEEMCLVDRYGLIEEDDDDYIED